MLGRLDVPADLIRGASFRFGVCCLVTELGEGVAECDELGDLGVQVGEPFVEPVADVFAGRHAAVPDAEDLPDLGEGQASCLAASDEVEPAKGLGRVVPVAGGGALRGWEESLVFIEPERLGRGAGCLGELTDPH